MPWASVNLKRVKRNKADSYRLDDRINRKRIRKFSGKIAAQLSLRRQRFRKSSCLESSTF